MATEEIAAGHRTWYVKKHPSSHSVPPTLLSLSLPLSPSLSVTSNFLTRSWCSGNTIVEAGQKGPKYFSEAGYRCPTDPRDSLMQYAFQTKLTIFEYMNSMPRVLKDFNTFMGNTMGARKYWTDWFPVQERLLDGANESSPLLVDVGGGKGHDVLDFQARYPQKGRRLVLQDLLPVTSDLPAIERMTYDFFTEQPVRGKVNAFNVPWTFQMAGILRCHRSSGVLLSSHTPRLARLVLLEDLGAGQEGHGARLLKANHSRAGPSRAEC